MSPQPGEIWLADLGLAAKTRPVVIVSRQDPDPPRSSSCTCLSPLSGGTAVRLERRIGRLSTEVMEHLKDALAFALDLERASE